MSTVQYLLDEHVDKSLRKAVKNFSPAIVIWRIGDVGVPPCGTLDPDILLWCEERKFILVTNNRASMPVHLKEHLAAGRHIWGIFLLNAKMSLRDTAQELFEVWGASELEEYKDLIWFLPVTK